MRHELCYQKPILMLAEHNMTVGSMDLCDAALTSITPCLNGRPHDVQTLIDDGERACQCLA